MKDLNTNKSSLPATENQNFFKNMATQVKLISRLMGDNRVSGFAKTLPIVSLIYLISPIDFISGALMPVIGAVDDIAVVWFGLNFFLELCPADVVEEHRAQLLGTNTDEIVDGEVVDGEVIE